MSLTEFINKIGDNPALIIVVVLTLGVILVNGWTDAPNAIATCVTTRSMKPKPAILMAAVMNFLGVFVMTMLTPKVAATISNMVDFSVVGDAANTDASIALCAALFSIVVWATAAWAFGIPTSESHALIAGLTGAAIALGGTDGVNINEWIKVIYGLFLSVFLGFFAGFLVTKLVEAICRNMDRVKTVKFFKGAQVVSAGSMAFMHGAQDGQKFMGIFLLGIELMESTGANVSNEFDSPLWLMVVCSLVMALGTSMGGEKIIKTVGMDMVKLETYQGFSADLSASLCLVLASVFGLPVSTTHTKNTAMMGVGASKRLSAINLGTVKEMVLAWVLTFPGCGLLSFAMVKLFMWIF